MRHCQVTRKRFQPFYYPRIRNAIIPGDNLMQTALGELSNRLNMPLYSGLCPFPHRIWDDFMNRLIELFILNNTLHKSKLLIKGMLRGIIVHLEFLRYRRALLHHKIRIIARDIWQHMPIIRSVTGLYGKNLKIYRHPFIGTIFYSLEMRSSDIYSSCDHAAVLIRKKLVPVLSTLWEMCGTGIGIELANEVPEQTKYPLTADKLLRMYRGAIDNGFTSFAEA